MAREMYVGSANGIVPIIGGWLVDAWLPHNARVNATPPPVRASSQMVPRYREYWKLIFAY